MSKQERFPILLFSIYIIFYAGQALQSAYQSLYLTQIGFSPSQIGTITSIATVVMLILQTYFGSLSDKSHVKNRVLYILYVGSFIMALLFYCSTSFWPVLIILALFGGFYTTIMPLSDNLTMSFVEGNTKYDYGIVRMGGTIGYCIMTLASGYFLNDNYRPIFLIIAGSLFLSFLLVLTLPKKTASDSHKKEKKNFLFVILHNKVFLTLIAFNLLVSAGENFFYSYYSIYFLEIGGNSRLVGILMFACAVSEIPCLFLVGRFARKFGVGTLLGFCAAIACFRWFGLYFISDPILCILICLLHGITYSGINYCLVNYINAHIPSEAKASSQIFKGTSSTIFSKVILGYFGGLMYEFCGPRSLLLVSGIIVGIASVFMFLWSKNKKEELAI